MTEEFNPYQVPSAPLENQQTSPTPVPGEPQGFSGWMTWPIIRLFLCLVQAGSELPHRIEMLPQRLRVTHAGYRASFFYLNYLNVADTICLIIFTCLALYILWNMFNKKARTPKLCIAFFIGQFIWVLANAAIDHYFINSDIRLSKLDNIQKAMRAEYILTVRYFAYMMIFVPYFYMSKQVKNTFIR